MTERRAKDRVPTVAGGFTRAIVFGAARYGFVWPTPLLEELRALGPRSSFSFQEQLWSHVAAEATDELLGLRIGAELQIGHLESAGLLMMSSGTLRDALEVLISYFPIISEGCAMSLHEGPTEATLRYTPSYDQHVPLRAELVLAFMAKMAQWLCDGSTDFILEMKHAPRAPIDKYTEIVGLPVLFEQPRYAMVFPAQTLDHELSQANQSLYQQLRTMADEAMQSLSHPNLASEIRTLLRMHPEWGRKHVADALAMSPRHLGRLLQDDGISFRELRDEVLFERAQELLQNADKKIRELALELGFADESAFAKAFRRWSGRSPGDYRKSVLSEDDARFPS